MPRSSGLRQQLAEKKAKARPSILPGTDAGKPEGSKHTTINENTRPVSEKSLMLTLNSQVLKPVEEEAKNSIETTYPRN